MLSGAYEVSDIEGMKMKINSKNFRVRPGEKVQLKEWPTSVKPFCKSKEEYQELLREHVEELSSLQQLHYASNRYALVRELSASMRSTLLSLFSDRDEDPALGPDAANNNLHGAVSGRQRWQRYVDLI